MKPLATPMMARKLRRSRTAIKDGLNTVVVFRYLPHVIRRTCTELLVSPNPDT